MEELKSILHELYVFSEWKPEPEYLQKPDNVLSENISTLWKWLKFFGPKKSLIDSVNAHKENQQKWHIALGDEGKVIAILADNILEIRTKRSEYATIAARTTVARDPYPQWRKLVWSPDCSFLALAYGNGVVSFFDLTASNLFNIAADCSRPGGMECTDNTHAVVDIIFMPLQVKDNKWSWEVALVSFDGHVRGFRVSAARAGPAARARLAPALSAAVRAAPHACLVVAGVPASQDPNSALGAGLSSWRTLSEEPHYQLSAASDRLDTQLAGKPFQVYIPFVSRKNMAFIVEMALSPDQSKLVCLHCNGEVSVWSLPLLKLLHRHPLVTQPQHDLRNPLLVEEKPGKRDLGLFHPASVNWWSNDEIILSRFSGVVTVCNISDMVNILGKKPEFFQGVPRVTCAHHGGFMVLECECNIVPAKKSRSDESMEVVRVEEDVEDSLLETSKELLKSVLYAITDMEAFQPKPRRITVATRIYRLLGVRSTTPQDLFARKIESGKYEEALALAETYGLDSDLVYQQQWRKNPVSTEAIHNYLSKVSKKIWAVHQCVDRLPESLAAAGALLACGLRLTEEQALAEINKDREEPITDPEDITLEHLNAYTTELLRCRHVMLFYKERLILYEAILKLEKSTYVKDEYDRLRSNSIVHSSIEIAKEGRIEALTCLWPQIKTTAMQLAVLDNIPETINPFEYQHLLPAKQPIQLFEEKTPIEIPPSEHENDWCRKDIFRSIWSSNWSEDLTPESDSASIDIEEISKWYEKRSREIESRSGLVSHALTLSTLATVGGGVEGLDTIMFHLLTLDTLIYDINVENVTLEEVEKMSELETCAMLMKMSTPETFVSDLKQLVVPFLKRCEKLSKRRDACLSGLMDYLGSLSTNDLSYILLVLQSPNEFELDVRTHLELAERCLYAYRGTDQLSLACDLLQTILQESDGSISSSELVRRVGAAQRVVAASAKLGARGVPAAWSELRQAEPSAARTLLQRAARCSDDEKRTKEDWESLLNDLLELQETIFECISVQEVYEIYASALLTSGESASIKLAGTVLTCSRGVANGGHLVDYRRSVELVSTAAKEYFNSASSLTDPALELARCCLQLIKEDDPDIQQELDLIAALRLLSAFRVELIPIQVRLCEDKMTLIEECMKADPSAYNASHKLLKLAKLLRVADKDDVSRESLVLIAVLTVALERDASGHTAAVAAARRLAELRAARAAPLLARAARLPGASALHAAALALLPARHLPAAAAARLEVELESLAEVSAALRGHNAELERQHSTDDEFSDAVTTPVIERKDLVAPPKPGKSQPLFNFLMDSIQNKFSSRHEATESPISEPSLHCPEFYRSLYPACAAASDEFCYSGFSVPDAARPALAVLKCYYTQSCVDLCANEDLEMDILQQCAEQYLYRDTALGVACLMRTSQDVARADRFIDRHCTNTGLSCTTYAALLKCNSCELRAATYTTAPARLAKITLTEKNASQEQLDLIRKCVDKLSGTGEGDALRNLGFSVNSIMFNSDADYRAELIYRVARSSEKEHVLTAFSLGSKYRLDPVAVWLEHACAAAQDSRAYVAPPPKADRAYERVTAVLWPKISGTDHNGLINYFNAIRTLDDKTTIHGLTPDAHVKLLKKVKACAGIDYKQLLSPASSSALAAHLVAGMVAAGDGGALLARLLRSLPPPLRAPAPPAQLQAAALAEMLFQIPDAVASNKKWMQQYRQCASYFSKLGRAALRDLHRAVCLSDQGVRRIRGSTRALMLMQTVEYCEQEHESDSRLAFHNDSEESWHDVAKRLTGWKDFLERLHSPAVQAIVADYLPDLEQQWIEIEKTGGEEDALEEAMAPLWMTRGRLATLLPLLAPPPPPPRRAALRAAARCRGRREHLEIFVDHLIEFHKQGTKWDDELIQMVLELATEHGLPPHQQIALLSLSDKSVVRETGDMTKVAKFCVELFHTEWQDCDYAKNITEDQLSTEAGRMGVFRELLSRSGAWARRKALADVLSCWPTTRNDQGRSLQCEYLQFLLPADSMLLIKLMLPSDSLPAEDMKWLAENSGAESALRLVWAMLLQKHPHYQDDIVRTLMKHKETIQDEEIDDELVKELLDGGMFLKLVATPLYPAIITYIISRETAGGEPSTAYTVKWATDQLVAANHLAEAAHLFLTSSGVPAPLLGFSQAVQYARNVLRK